MLQGIKNELRGRVPAVTLMVIGLILDDGIIVLAGLVFASLVAVLAWQAIGLLA